MSNFNTLTVQLAERSYDILIGPGLIQNAGKSIMAAVGTKRCIIITDENVAAHWLAPLQDSLDAAGLAYRSIMVPPGEQTKSFSQLESVVRDILANGLERKDIVIALGGGVIGDLAGFAAAIAMRGVDFVQIPTSLLAQVDSSVGGKTGINTPEGKNLVGAFHQPRLVIADTDTLGTLPARELRSGYAEVVKYGVIDDLPFFQWLEAHSAAALALEPDTIRQAIVKSCQSKARIVAEDELESGKRALLNLGHTFAHALEAEAGFDGTLLHGEAVSIGMVMALQASERLGLAQNGTVDSVRNLLSSQGLTVDLRGIANSSWTVATLVHHMGHDKKMASGKLTFVMVHGVGQSFLTNEVDMTVVEAVLADALEQALQPSALKA